MGGPFDIDAMSIDHGDIGIQFTELGEIDGAVFVEPIVDKGAAVSGGGDKREEGEVVDVDTGKWHGVDFVFGSTKGAFPYRDINKTSTAIVGKILGSKTIV